MKIKIEEMSTDGNEKKIKKYEKLLNYNSLTDFKRNIPDNHDNFMARVIATSPFYQ